MISSKTSPMELAPLTTLEFRQALGQFATGVAVITAERSPGVVHGMTANSFTSVSLEPLLILVCVDQNARLLPLLNKQKRFGISVLTKHQQAISEFFAQPEQNQSDEEGLGIRFRWTQSGVPVLEDTLVQLSCNVVMSTICGDHTIFVAEVEAVEVHEGEPLLYFQGNYRRMAEQC